MAVYLGNELVLANGVGGTSLANGHASTHAKGGSDELAPADIGAAEEVHTHTEYALKPVSMVVELPLDGWVGLVVALFILFSAYKAAKETLSPLLGQAPDPELVQHIRDIVEEHDTVVGIHDLVVHDYGPGRQMVSLHAEVPASGDILQLHDVIDNIERELHEKLHVQAVIHMDPIVTDDETVDALRRQVAELVRQVEPRMTVHDLRVIRGTTHTNLVFDAVLPLDAAITPAEAGRRIREKVAELDGDYYAVVTVEHSFTE